VAGWSNGSSSTAVRLISYTRINGSNLIASGARRLDTDAFASSGAFAGNGNANLVGSLARWSSGNFLTRLNGAQSTGGAVSSGNTSNTASLNVFLASPDGVTVRLQGVIAAVVAVSPEPPAALLKRIEHALGRAFYLPSVA